MSKKRKSKKKNKVNAATVVAGIILGLIIVLSIILVSLLSKMSLISEEGTSGSGEFVEVTEAGEEMNFDTLLELRGDNNLSAILESWAKNTTENSLMKSKNVINFLLIGVDDSNSNADAIIIASLNKNTKKIHLTSVFRDSYTYIKTDGSGTYAKINSCFANGGAYKLIETIENDFKIKIDYYVSVSFDSFSSIVDTLGGITLDVQPYEATAVGMNCPSGEDVLLNGEQALKFCRIRYCDVDADVSRTRRQRQFINALIDETKNISITQISPLLNTIIKYIKTDCSVSDMISFGTQALTEKWYNFEIVSGAVPKEEHRLDFNGSAWVWIVDYPAAAKDLQESIYGTSNIELKEDRISAIDIVRSSGNIG